MLDREEVDLLYELLLDRSPEDQAVYADDREGKSASQVAADFMASEEFIDKNRFWLTLLLPERGP